MAAGLTGYALAPPRALPALLAPTVAWSLGNLLLSGRAFAVVSGLAPAGASARYLAIFGLSWGFATVAAPPLGIWLVGGFGPDTLWTSMAVTCLAMGVLQPCLLRGRVPVLPPRFLFRCRRVYLLWARDSRDGGGDGPDSPGTTREDHDRWTASRTPCPPDS
jgi:hypothetical protein